MGILTPLGVPDYDGAPSKDYIKLKYTISGQAADKVELLLRKGAEVFYTKVIEDPQLLSVGTHEYHWDGFDDHGILDTAFLTSHNFNFYTKIYCQGETKFKTIDFSGVYDEVKWVDVRIDKNAKRIDVTLRVNLTDGGEKGTEKDCVNKDFDYDSKHQLLAKVCPWDKISKEALSNERQPPIQQRTKSFEELKQLVLDGMQQYWSRHQGNIGKCVEINGIKFDVFVTAKNVSDSSKSLDDIPLIFNTNNWWSRSGNPGGNYSDCNPSDEVIGSLKDGWIQQISYNTGYIRHNWDNAPYDGWIYDNELESEADFKITAAHEIGHEILQAFGNTIYSWQHKGSSYYFPQNRKPLEGNETVWGKISNIDFMDSDGERVPSNGEIDLMKYYRGYEDMNRKIASVKDVLGLIWLSKIELK